MANFSFGYNTHTASLILNRRPIIIVKRYLRVLNDAFWGAFRCMFYYSFNKKNYGDPYYEPTVLIHDTVMTYGLTLQELVAKTAIPAVWWQPTIWAIHTSSTHDCQILFPKYMIKHNCTVYTHSTAAFMVLRGPKLTFCRFADINPCLPSIICMGAFR